MGLNDIIIKIVEFIMILAPYGVFALLASLIVDLGGSNPDKAFDILIALLWYGLTVLIGLVLMVAVVYPIIFKLFTKVKYSDFFKAIRPAQLLAFSTSSSAATLPVTMERVEKRVGRIRRSKQLCVAPGRNYQHGRHQPVPGRGRRIHRAGFGTWIDNRPAIDDRFYGPAGFYRNRGRAKCGVGDVGDCIAGHWRADRRTGADFGARQNFGYVPHGGKHNR